MTTTTDTDLKMIFTKHITDEGGHEKDGEQGQLHDDDDEEH